MLLWGKWDCQGDAWAGGMGKHHIKVLSQQQWVWGWQQNPPSLTVKIGLNTDQQQHWQKYPRMARRGYDQVRQNSLKPCTVAWGGRCVWRTVEVLCEDGKRALNVCPLYTWSSWTEAFQWNLTPCTMCFCILDHWSVILLQSHMSQRPLCSSAPLSHPLLNQIPAIHKPLSSSR